MHTELMLTLEPPGNVGRELALYRREFFARLGEGSALAYPEAAPLAIASAVGRLPRGWPSRQLLEGCWKGIEGAFSGAGPLMARGLMYLALKGPLAELSLRASKILEGWGDGQAGLEPGIGFFICRPSSPPAALREAELIGPPSLRFLDCSLVLFGLKHPDDPFEALSWRELARARRHTGKSRA
jgi:hypothetical protein